MGNRRTLQTSVVAAVSAVSRGGVVAAVIVVAIVGLVLRLLLCLLVSLLLSLFLSLLGGICLLLGLHRGGDVGLGLCSLEIALLTSDSDGLVPFITVLASVMAFLQRGAGVFIGHTARGIIQRALRLRNSRAQVRFQCVGIGRRL